MRQVLVGIGSHIDRERHINACLDALETQFGGLRISRVFEGRFVGASASHNVYNLVVAFDSDSSVRTLRDWCKAIERANDRDEGRPETLDIDLLSVGDLSGDIDGVNLPHEDILHYAFVLKPLAELLPQGCHPVNGERYAELWANFDSGGQHLWPVDFIWRDRIISRAN